MSYYKYVGNQGGKKVSGKIQASSVDEASQRLKRMGIAVDKFGDDDDAIAPIINSAKTPASVTEEWQTFLPPHARTAAAESALKPVSTAVPSVAPSAPAQVTMTMAAAAPPPSEQSQMRIKDTIDGLSRAVKDHRPISPKRAQRYVFGEAESIPLMIDEMLNKYNGTVVHMSMSPDLHGKLKVAMVVEHDVMEMKK